MSLSKIATTFLLSGLLVGITACDDIEPGDRYIEGPEITAERAVLLEDFTGQQCLNCPAAHETIDELEEQFGSDKVIAVSIHCGSFGFSKSRTDFSKNRVGLMTEEGNAILETYGITSFPMGVIDMGSPLTYGLWATAVREALAKPTNVTIDLDVRYTADDKDGSQTGLIDVTAEIMSGETRTANIQFWIVEDNIVALQRNGSQTIPDYVHDGVFRAQLLPGVRGEAITITGGMTVIKDATIATRWNNEEHWVPENLSVVAFVSDSSGVLQVIRKPVISKDDENNNVE